MDGVHLTIDGFLHQHLLLIGAKRIGRTESYLTTGPATIGGIDIIVVAMLIEMTAFETGIITYHDDLTAYFVEILIQFHHREMINATDDIDLSIIEKHTWVIVVMCQTLHRPFALGVGSRKQPSLAVVTINQDIELTVMIFHRASPHTLRVEILTIAQVIPVVVKQFLQWVSTILPVHHIL